MTRACSRNGIALVNSIHIQIARFYRRDPENDSMGRPISRWLLLLAESSGVLNSRRAPLPDRSPEFP